MAHQQIFTGKCEDILRHSDELSGSDVRVRVLETADEPAVGIARPRNLAELLGDYIGAVAEKGEH